MARYVDAIDLPIPVETAFDFLADFSRTVEWDPGVVDARRLTDGPIGAGSRFGVTVSFLGQTLPFEYAIEAYERPSRLVLVGESDAVSSRDEITFVARPGGTRVTYEAAIELAGLRRLADPLVGALFQITGRLAVRGLRERFARGDAPRASGDRGAASSRGARCARPRTTTPANAPRARRAGGA
ncbi:MAG: SRPBCC family protein [Myxococcota bacterium]